MTQLKEVHGQMRIMGPSDTPRERFCVKVLQGMLLKLAETAGMPAACVLAFEWPDGTKMFIASQDDVSMEADFEGGLGGDGTDLRGGAAGVGREGEGAVNAATVLDRVGRALGLPATSSNDAIESQVDLMIRQLVRIARAIGEEKALDPVAVANRVETRVGMASVASGESSFPGSVSVINGSVSVINGIHGNRPARGFPYGIPSGWNKGDLPVGRNTLPDAEGWWLRTSAGEGVWFEVSQNFDKSWRAKRQGDVAYDSIAAVCKSTDRWRGPFAAIPPTETAAAFLQADILAQQQETSESPGSRATDTVEDPINPKHYKLSPSGVEAITVIEHMTFNLGTACKYMWRAGLKTPDPIEDLKKAIWYIQREVERLEKAKT